MSKMPEQQWFPVPYTYLEVLPVLSPTAKDLLVYLCSLTWGPLAENGARVYTQVELAEALMTSERSIRRALVELTSHGVVVQTKPYKLVLKRTAPVEEAHEEADRTVLKAAEEADNTVLKSGQFCPENRTELSGSSSPPTPPLSSPLRTEKEKEKEIFIFREQKEIGGREFDFEVVTEQAKRARPLVERPVPSGPRVLESDPAYVDARQDPCFEEIVKRLGGVSRFEAERWALRAIAMCSLPSETLTPEDIVAAMDAKLGPLAEEMGHPGIFFKRVRQWLEQQKKKEEGGDLLSRLKPLPDGTFALEHDFKRRQQLWESMYPELKEQDSSEQESS